MHTLIRRANSDQKGITGLETAIILIAFVMVASVFSYVVLSAGLFSAQKAKEAVHAGLEEVRSTMELKGDVLAKTESGIVTNIIFTVGAHPKGEPIDFTDTTEGKNKVVISYADAYQQYPSLGWTLTKLVSVSSGSSSTATPTPVSSNGTTSDNLLDDNELFQIDVNVKPVNDAAPSDDAKLGPYRTFTLEVKPPKGAILAIERSIPPRMDRIINLK